MARHRRMESVSRAGGLAMPIKRPPNISRRGRGVRYGAKTVTFARNGGVEAAIARLRKQPAGDRVVGYRAIRCLSFTGRSSRLASRTSSGIRRGASRCGLSCARGLAESRELVRLEMRKLAKAVRGGEISMQTALGRLGVFAAGLIQAKIIEGPFEPISKKTIAARKRRTSARRPSHRCRTRACSSSRSRGRSARGGSDRRRC